MNRWKYERKTPGAGGARKNGAARAPASVHIDALVRAAKAVGGTEKLSKMLGVSPQKLDHWMRGEEVPSTSIFLHAVDLIERFRR